MIVLIAADYFNTYYHDISGGPFRNAILRKKEFKNSEVYSYPDCTLIDGVRYEHKEFTEAEYNKQKKEASELYYNHTPLHAVELKKSRIQSDIAAIFMPKKSIDYITAGAAILGFITIGIIICNQIIK